MNYYEILEVSQSATQEIIKIAYKNLAKKYHPDIVGTELANEKMQKLNEAYEILCDPEKRKEYDANLLLDNENYSCEEANNGYQDDLNPYSKVIDKFKEEFITILITIGTTTFCYMKGWNNWFIKLWCVCTIGWLFIFFCEVVDLILENSFAKKVLKCLAFFIGIFVWFKLMK